MHVRNKEKFLLEWVDNFFYMAHYTRPDNYKGNEEIPLNRIEWNFFLNSFYMKATAYYGRYWPLKA